MIPTPDVIFSPKRMGENEVFGINFSRIIRSDDAIVSGSVTITLVKGKGSTVGMLIDAPIVATPWVQQMIRGGSKGATYHVRFIANTAGGERKIVLAELTVTD